MRKVIIWIVVITLLASIIIPSTMVFFNPSVSAPGNTDSGNVVTSTNTLSVVSTGELTNTGQE